jgi:hypothetical protein
MVYVSTTRKKQQGKAILIASFVKPPVDPLSICLVIRCITTDNVDNKVRSNLHDVLWISKRTL